MATSITNTSVTTDQLNVDSNTLYVDATNNRVGVGTASPNRTMEITDGTSGKIRTSGTSGGFIECWNGTNGVYFGTAPSVLGTGNGGDSVIFTDSGFSQLYYTSGVERMKIDSSGRVTMPYQPAFYVYNLNFPGSGAAGTASGGSVSVNIGSHYSTTDGRFTAPIAGTYMFSMMTQAYDSGNTSGNYQTAVFRKNGSNIGGETYHGWQPNDGNNHVQAQNTIIVTLSANDYIQAYVQYGSRDIQNFFCGYLIG